MVKDLKERANASEISEYFELNFGENEKNSGFVKQIMKQEK